jgi:membrane protease YdiL (CAAX protease family)
VGLIRVHASDVRASLFFIPLVLIILSNGAFFFDTKTPAFEILMTVVFMVLVAISEELLFRGMLFKAIEERSGSKAAVIVSGITFGFGHIVNLFTGYSGVEQIMQIAVAVLIGVVLSLLFIRTKSIMPGIVFHFLFNTASALSVEVEPLYNYVMVGVIVVIGVAYLIYLLRNISNYLYRHGEE